MNNFCYFVFGKKKQEALSTQHRLVILIWLVTTYGHNYLMQGYVIKEKTTYNDIFLLIDTFTTTFFHDVKSIKYPIN